MPTLLASQTRRHRGATLSHKDLYPTRSMISGEAGAGWLFRGSFTARSYTAGSVPSFPNLPRLAVAQERPPAVVMLTKAFEKGKPMSAAYIPASKGSQNQYGTVNVVNLGVDKVCV